MLINISFLDCKKAGETGIVKFRKLNNGNYEYTDTVHCALLNASPLMELPEGYTSILSLEAKQHYESRP
jgi:hypothetical protein